MPDCIRNIPGHGPILDPRRTIGTTLCVATPFFRPSLPFLKSMMRLQRVCSRLGIRLQWLTVRVPLIDIARDELAGRFLRRPDLYGDVVLFIDNDEGWTVRAAFDAIRLARTLDVVGVTYPFKMRNWTNVWHAARQIGVHDAERVLPKVSTETRVAIATNRRDSTFGRPVECEFLGTGFLAVHRRVFDRIAEAHPELWYDVGAYQSEDSGPSAGFFMPMVHRGMRMGEDLSFCLRWRELGGQMWGLFWHEITHTGEDEFDDDLGTRLGLRLPIGVVRTMAPLTAAGTP